MQKTANLPNWASAQPFKKLFKALFFSFLAIFAAEVKAQAQVGMQSFPTDSLSVTYFGSGKPRIIASYKDALLHGPTFEYHASGQINSITHFYDGEKSGEQKLFDQAGRLQWVKTWQSDRMHGEERHYYQDGQIQSRASWSNNQKHGTTTFYYELGGVAAELLYQFGEQVSSTYYDEEGNVKKNQH